MQILAPSISRLALLGAHEFEVFDLPFLFRDYDAVHRVTGGEVGQKLMAGLAPYGLEGIAFLDNGFKDMSANRPLHEPADYKGLQAHPAFGGNRGGDEGAGCHAGDPVLLRNL